MSLPIFQSAQIHALEQKAITALKIDAYGLMQRAAKAAFEVLLRKWPKAQKIAVFVGLGNNGGDGYALTALLKEHGSVAMIWQVGGEPRAPEAKKAFAQCEKLGIEIKPFHTTIDLMGFDLIIDAICGMGLHSLLRPETQAAIDFLNNQVLPVLALDVPSGVDSDTGQLWGKPIKATVTVTFIGAKVGLLTGPGVSFSGEIILQDLNINTEILTQIPPLLTTIPLSLYSECLKPRLRNWHKSLSGHVLIVGGDPGYVGAVRIAAEAALRVGAGLVTVATHQNHAAAIMAHYPEIMCHTLSDAKSLQPLLAKADVVIFGGGLMHQRHTKTLLNTVLLSSLPCVLDAGAFYFLEKIKEKRENWVLTPHPGEAATLLNTHSDAIQQDRFSAVQQLQERYGGVIVLKGAGTLVASQATYSLCDKGNPGMSSAGMGDALSGIIGGLIAQKLTLEEAAKLGVLFHALAGDLAAKEGERGLVASDLLPYLRRLLNGIAVF